MYIKLRILQGSCKIFCARSYPNQKWAENIHEEILEHMEYGNIEPMWVRKKQMGEETLSNL